jgi:hypothetical protein
MDKKTDLQKQIERETGLDIAKIEDQQQLNTCLDQGLAQLYKNAFAEPPYCENFSIEEVKKFFQEYFDEGGFIFVATNPQQGDKPVAFLVTVPLKAHFDLAAKTARYVDTLKTTYFADAGVDPAYRRRDISVKMKQILFEKNALAGFKQGLSRTSQESYKQISAFNKVGGKAIAGLFQDVASKRLDGTIVTDRRIFYAYDMATQKQDAAKATMFDRVIITRMNGQDTAILPASIPRQARRKTANRLKAAYPGISRVTFAKPWDMEKIGKDPARNILFDGRIYLANDGNPGIKKTSPKRA